MNYIKRLEADVQNRDARIEAAMVEITDFIHFLYSEKFRGVESDGSRKDWIATGDVLHQLQNLRDALSNR